MSSFTGILGSNNAQPGAIQLGTGLTGAIGVADGLTVAQDIVFDVQQGKWKRLGPTVSVGQTIGTASLIVRSLTSTVSVSQTITPVPSPYARVTQTLVEVVYTSTVSTRLTQTVVEVAYKRDTRQTVTHAIHVAADGRPGFNNVQSLTSTVAVAQTIGQRNTNVRLPLTSTVNVASAVAFRNTNVRLNVTSTATVTPAISLRNTKVRLSVTNTATATQQIIPAGVHNLAVASTVTVASAVGIANTVNRITVTSPITVTTGVGFAGISDFITAHDTIGVSQTIGARSNVNRQTVTSTISVNSLGRAKDVSVPKTVTSTVGVAQTPFGRNTNVRINVTSSINAATPTGERDTQNRITVTAPVNVTTTAVGRNTNNRISVTHTITIPSDGFFAPVMEVDPNKQTVYSVGNVSQTVDLQNSNPRLVVTDLISVGQTIGNNQLSFSLLHNIGLAQSLTGGNSNRAITVHDFVTVSDNTDALNAVSRQSVTSRGIINDHVYGQGPLVTNSVTDRVVVNTTVAQRVVLAMSVSDHVTVTPNVRFAGATTQSVTSAITVTPSMRVSPVVMSVLSTIHADTTLKLAEITTHQFVHVAQAVHFSLLKRVNDTLAFTQTVVASRVFNRVITQSLGLSQVLDRSMTYERSALDRLVFPESGITRPISLPPGQIIVPVAAGTLVDAIVILQSSAGAITLPKPEFNDAENNVNEMKVKRTMTGLAYTFIKSTDRRNLNYTFRIPTLKALELRSWVIASISEQIVLTNWKAEVWLVRFAKNPFETTNAARWSSTERVDVEIELEGVKISG